MALPSYSENLTLLALDLIDQKAARVLVEPNQRASGFWFGGGNMVQGKDGSIYLIGRFRSQGDSRTGVDLGDRGRELAIYRADSVHGTFEKIVSWTKEELKCGEKEVVSIEGASLLLSDDRVELFVSTEKNVAYPEDLADFQKPGTGVWTIDVLSAPTLEALKGAEVKELVTSDVPSRLHVKDPTAVFLPGGDTALIYCNHPYTWSSSNTSLAVRQAGSDTFDHVTHEMLHRGPVWDVAVTRVTDRMPVPPVGRMADCPPVSLYFYDGAEGLRQLDENPNAVKRPRGWSCEEISGVAFGEDKDFPHIDRLSMDRNFFTSPWGTGCSRYISTLVTEEGIFAAWQQSQEDLSQPLVGHFLPMEKVEKLLS